MLTSPPSEAIEVAPRQAARLCGQSLDWIEIVTRVRLSADHVRRPPLAS
jgi:hypothetical protein